MLDSDSLITIFTQANLRKVDVTFARPMPKIEKYVDDNTQPQED